MYKVGDRFKNLKNGTYGEIRSIRNGIATMLCQERIYGFFKETNELCHEVATRTIHLHLLKKAVDDGLYIKIED
jgi:hypothetical protein